MDTAITLGGWLCAALLTGALGALAYIDWRTGYLPDIIVAPLAAAGLGIAVVGSPVGVSWPLAMAGAVINAGVFLALRWVVSRLKGREAMGLGDVKLVGAAGFWLGPFGLPYIMAVGGLATLAGAGIAGLVTGKPVWRGEMPLGPGLALGTWGVFLLQLTHVISPTL